MRMLPKELAFAVHFCRVSSELGIPASDLAQMIAEARRSVSAYERGDTKAEDKHGIAVADIAERHGCVVDWPGLWPCVQKAGLPRTNQLLPSFA